MINHGLLIMFWCFPVFPFSPCFFICFFSNVVSHVFPGFPHVFPMLFRYQKPWSPWKDHLKPCSKSRSVRTVLVLGFFGARIHGIIWPVHKFMTMYMPMYIILYWYYCMILLLFIYIIMCIVCLYIICILYVVYIYYIYICT